MSNKTETQSRTQIKQAMAEHMKHHAMQSSNISKNKTITEMIFVDDNIPDGNYLLTIQIPAFVSDAAPSRPIIFNINEL